MSDATTAKSDASVESYLAGVEPEDRREDCRELVMMMQAIVGEAPAMWGASIVGFGRYHYVYASGREGDWMLTGFAGRKSALTVYIMDGFEPHAPLLARLGPYKTGKSCLYLKSLSAVDQDVLRQIICDSVANMRRRYEC